MPEGDTLFRAAAALERALAGKVVTRFESVYPHLTRVDVDDPLAGRSVVRVESRGKHLLMHFERDLVLHTHMRMNGTWHIYRPGERWRKPRSAFRIRVATAEIEAVAFDVPVARFLREADLPRDPVLSSLGPDASAESFDVAEAARRLAASPRDSIADALLDQRAFSGVGNVYKSEILFLCRIHPSRPVGALGEEALRGLAATAHRLLRANVGASATGGIVTWTGLRRTTHRSDPGARLWVYGRGGAPCRRCGTPIAWARHGADARSTYWCPTCQPAADHSAAEDSIT